MGEDGEADGADFFDGGVDEREHDVEVVDHEVEDDVDVERAGGEDAEAVRLEEHGAIELGAGGVDGGVETFEVADLDEAIVLPGEGDELIGLCEGGGEGFFDEDVEAGGEQGRGGCGVMDGGDADAGGVDGEVGGEEGLDVGEGGDVVVGGGGVAGFGVGVDDGGQGDGGARGFKLAVDAEVVAAEGSGAEDGEAGGGLRGQGVTFRGGFRRLRGNARRA